MPVMPLMPAMPGMRPLMIMLRALGYAAIPAWPAGVTAAVLWSGRVELALLTIACVGSNSALTLRVVGWAQARARRRSAEYERLMAERDAQFARLEHELCVAVAELHPRGRIAMTQPDLRVVR
jgi:hypothetical protein